jgi:radical SAM superfamily enzyme YgiQ (UPF0313 family)
MRVALIHYDVNRIVNEPGNKTVMKHFGHMPNIQLLYVAGVLEKIGVEVNYADIVGMELSDSDLDLRLKRFDPDIIAFSVYTSHFHNTVSYARHFKSIVPRAKIMVGGVHATLFPHETMNYNKEIDFTCVGEAEMVLPAFVERWEKGEGFEGLRGILWRDGEEVKYAGPPAANNDLDSCPFPARHLVPNEKYFNFISTYRNYTVFNSSRGCPYPCIFCEAARTKFRARSPENVVAEFEECYEKHGVREIDIFDSSFTVRKDRVFKMCELLCKSGLNKKLVWNVRSRVDSINEELLEAMREAGCYRIFYGVESGNDEVLHNLRKGIKLDRIKKIISKTDEIGISAFAYFLIGAPGETPESVRQTIDFAKALPLDFAIFNCLTAFPKTELYEKYYLPESQHDFWEEYMKSPEPTTAFMGRPWTKMEDQELRRMAHSAMLEFYFRPGQVVRAIRSVRSVDQMRRFCSAGVDMTVDYIKRVAEIKSSEKGSAPC